jgi:hypothetical protein
LIFKKICSIDESAKFYFDHKKGFDLKTALELDNAHGDYWRPILKNLTMIFNVIALTPKNVIVSLHV